MYKYSILLFMFSSTPTWTDVPNVVTDIPPVHSLVEQVMRGVGEAEILLRSGASAHDYTMKPSDAGKLQNADVVFWIGDSLTPWLVNPIKALASDAEVVELLDTKGTRALKFDGVHSEVESAHDEDHSHNHDGIDPHAWLDPENGQVWLEHIATTLSRIDPDNAGLYQANARLGIAGIDILQMEIESALQTAPDFAVMHDSLRYFTHRFGLPEPLALADSEARQPGVARIAALRKEATQRSIACVLIEPGTSKGTIDTVFEGQRIKAVEFDPTGSNLQQGSALYLRLLQSLGEFIGRCAQQ